jgi:hypothetical protein
MDSLLFPRDGYPKLNYFSQGSSFGTAVALSSDDSGHVYLLTSAVGHAYKYVCSPTSACVLISESNPSGQDIGRFGFQMVTSGLLWFVAAPDSGPN